MPGRHRWPPSGDLTQCHVLLGRRSTGWAGTSVVVIQRGQWRKSLRRRAALNLPHNGRLTQLPFVVVARSDDFPTGFRQLPASVDQLLTDLMSVGRDTAVTRALTDVYLTDDPATLNVTVDIAGLDSQTLEVILDGDMLTIRGGRRRPAETGRRVYQHVEIDWGRFERRVRIETPVDPASAAVTYDRGLLQIALRLAPRPVVARVLIGVRIPG